MWVNECRIMCDWYELQIQCNKDVSERQNKVNLRLVIMICNSMSNMVCYYFVGWPWTTPQQHQLLVSYNSFLKNRIYVHTVVCFLIDSSVSQPFFHGEGPKIIFHTLRNLCIWKWEQNKETVVAHRDYSSTANGQTKIPARGIWNFLWYVRIFIYLFHNFLWNPWQWCAEPWLGNADLTKQGVLSTDSVVLGHPWLYCQQ